MIEKILERLEKLTTFSHPFINEKLVCKADVIEIVQEVAKDGGWIPCSERLPKESLNSVLGWDEYRERCVFVQYLQGRWILGNDESVKIIAWQPLPASYRPKED